MSASRTRPSRVKLYGVEGFIPVVEIGDAWSAAVAEDATTACALICLSSPGRTGSAQINRVPPAYVRLGAAALRAAGKFTRGSLRYVDIVAGHWQIETRKTTIVNSVMGLSGATGGVFSGSVACTVRGEIDLVVFNSDQGDGAPCPVTMSGSTVLTRLDLDLLHMQVAAATAHASYWPWAVNDQAVLFVHPIRPSVWYRQLSTPTRTDGGYRDHCVSHTDGRRRGGAHRHGDRNRDCHTDTSADQRRSGPRTGDRLSTSATTPGPETLC